MQQENLNTNLFCRFCLRTLSSTNPKVIEEAEKDILEIGFPNLNLETHNLHMCKICCSKLLDACNFKTTCMDTEDIISHISADEMSVIELKEVYLKVNENIQLSDMWENQKICRLCLQLVTYEFLSLNEVDNDIIDAYIPQVNIGATKKPVICGSCFNSLNTHGGFVKSCLKAQEKYESGDKQPYIKSEEIEVKLEDGDNVQAIYQNIDEPSFIKIEEIQIKLEDGYNMQEKFKNIESYIKSEEIAIKSEDQNDSSSHNQTIERTHDQISQDVEEIKHEYKLECETKVPKVKRDTKLRSERRDKSDLKIRQLTHKASAKIQMHQCDACPFKAKYNSHLKFHQLTHKDPSEIQMYKCDACDYKTKRRFDLKTHQLTHKDPSKIQMYKCDICPFQSKYKGGLKNHQLVHKDPSEIHIYKCDVCAYGTKYSSHLKLHQLTHKDPSEIQMYKCDNCTYETKYKCHLKLHELTHKDPSEIQMYKCGICSFETKYKVNLKTHQVIHEDPSEMQRYKCDTCDYKTKRKYCLTKHQLTHKDPSETQIYRCDICSYAAKHKNHLKRHQLLHKNQRGNVRM